MKFNSKKYWENRYSKNGDSGLGSYGDEYVFKKSYINKLILEKNIGSIIDLGCGDGNQIKEIIGYDQYLGYDVSMTIIEKCKILYNNIPNINFTCDINELTMSDLAMSLDVTYHIIEDKYFEEYMNMLFNLSKKYVLIYSINSDNSNGFAIHLKNRKICEFIKNKFSDFILVDNIKYKKKDNGIGFFLYEKK